MHITARPSKTFLFFVLDRLLKDRYDDTGLDAASANFKNRKKFRTKHYLGLDYDLDLLKQGMDSNDVSSFGVWADISKLSGLSDTSIGIVVSTFTLYHLELGKQQDAIKHLCRIVRGDGLLICELPTSQFSLSLIQIIHQHFNEIKFIYFKNYLSRLYEFIVEDKRGTLKKWASFLPLRLLSLFIALFELITCKFRYGNSHVLIVARDKKTEANNNFDFDKFSYVEEQIINLMN